MLETQEEILAIQTVELESEGLGVLYLKSRTAFHKRPSLLCQSSCVFILFLGSWVILCLKKWTQKFSLWVNGSFQLIEFVKVKLYFLAHYKVHLFVPEAFIKANHTPLG